MARICGLQMVSSSFERNPLLCIDLVAKLGMWSREFRTKRNSCICHSTKLGLIFHSCFFPPIPRFPSAHLPIFTFLLCQILPQPPLLYECRPKFQTDSAYNETRLSIYFTRPKRNVSAFFINPNTARGD